MPADELPGTDPARLKLITAALRLVLIFVTFSVLSGTVSVITGLQDHSLGVLAIGLGVLADVTGSAVLIWRFRAERRQPAQSDAREARVAIIVASALAVVSAVLIIQAAAALASRSHPAHRADARRGRHLACRPHAPGLCQAPPRRPDGQPRA